MALMTACSYQPAPGNLSACRREFQLPEHGPGCAQASRIRKDAPAGNIRRAVMSR